LQESGLPERGSGRTLDGREIVRLKRWCGNTYWIGVAFDENGKVVGLSLAKVWNPRDGQLTAAVDDLRAWLGW
jgi:hypothetical protein